MKRNTVDDGGFFGDERSKQPLLNNKEQLRDDLDEIEEEKTSGTRKERADSDRNSEKL